MERGNSNHQLTSKRSSWAKGMKLNRPPERNPCVFPLLPGQIFCDMTCRNVFGEIPGFPVGSTFANRIECSQAGVHGPWRAGIHGNQNEGAFSVVLYAFAFRMPWHILSYHSVALVAMRMTRITERPCKLPMLFLSSPFANHLLQNLHWSRCLLRQ